MMYETQLSKRAEIELNSSIDWYNEQKAGLGKRFYLKIKSTIKIIKRNPFAFEEKYHIFRCATVDVFPFVILYFIAPQNKIIISAIFHTSRNPDF